MKKTDDNAQDFKETGMYGIVNEGGNLDDFVFDFFLSLKCYKIQLASILNGDMLVIMVARFFYTTTNTRDWLPKFETGKNIKIDIVQKV